MNAIDKAILDADTKICKNISKFDDSDRGLLSQNILSQLRNFVEYIAMKLCSTNGNLEKLCLKPIVPALKSIF